MNRHQQRGMGTMALVAIVGVIGFFAWITLKVVPFYSDNAKVANAIENVKAQPEVATKGLEEVRDQILRRLGVDGVSRLRTEHFIKGECKKDCVQFEKTAEGFKMTVAYQDEARLFGDLYLVVKFEKTIEVP